MIRNIQKEIENRKMEFISLIIIFQNQRQCMIMSSMELKVYRKECYIIKRMEQRWFRMIETSIAIRNNISINSVVVIYFINNNLVLILLINVMERNRLKKIYKE